MSSSQVAFDCCSIQPFHGQRNSNLTAIPFPVTGQAQWLATSEGRLTQGYCLGQPCKAAVVTEGKA
jgi:hypothetical protein